MKWKLSINSDVPEQRYRNQTKQADKQLYIDPVSDEVSDQGQQASRDAPEVLDHDASERAILSCKQLAGHHEAGQQQALRQTQQTACLPPILY